GPADDSLQHVSECGGPPHADRSGGGQHRQEASLIGCRIKGGAKLFEVLVVEVNEWRVTRRGLARGELFKRRDNNHTPPGHSSSAPDCLPRQSGHFTWPSGHTRLKTARVACTLDPAPGGAKRARRVNLRVYRVDARGAPRDCHRPRFLADSLHDGWPLPSL